MDNIFISPESCLFVHLSAERNVEAKLSQHGSAVERTARGGSSKSAPQRRDTPRKRSEPVRSAVRSAITASASMSCPAGFSVPAEPDPVCAHSAVCLDC